MVQARLYVGSDACGESEAFAGVDGVRNRFANLSESSQSSDCYFGNTPETFEQRVLARQTPCRPGPLPEVARRIAEVHAELLLIHPFREGNGRLARWLADLMSLQAGLPLPKYEFSGREALRRQKAYLDAVTRGYARDYDPLTAFFAEAVSRRLEESGR